jgi:hypothetical protein
MLSPLWLIWCWFTGYKRIPHFMAVDSATKSLPVLSIWRNSLLFMFIFVYYSAWNIPFEHLHLCIPRCDQTLIYKHMCIPRLNIYLFIIYLWLPSFLNSVIASRFYGIVFSVLSNKQDGCWSAINFKPTLPLQ